MSNLYFKSKSLAREGIISVVTDCSVQCMERPHEAHDLLEFLRAIGEISDYAFETLMECLDTEEEEED